MITDIKKLISNKKGQNIMTYKPKTLTVKISTVRDMTYKKIDALVKDIKDNTSMSDHFISKVDINMKNAINKILNDYRYQEVNK